MLFNSYVFLLAFLPAVGLGYWLLAGTHARSCAAFLGLASLAFYSWSSPWPHIALMMASILFNYGVGRALGATRRTGYRKILLIAGIGGNFLVLAYFKYANFFLSQFSGIHLAAILLPLGISFYTFTQIAYLMDVHRNQAREYSFTHYLLFVTWFPHLIAGPIIHHKEMMPQFAESFRRRASIELLGWGLSIFAAGLAKKLLLADHFAPFADAIFDRAGEDGLTLMEGWGGAAAYALQIYFDFSAYSDMAIGLSLIFGVRLPLNFNSPYKSSSIVDFWSRWHMTLSRFLRDYLYIPLGGNRKGRSRRYVNLMITMLIGGLWHGAAWTFVAWGALHGVYLAINHAWRATGLRLPFLPAAALTFVSVLVAWVFFRAPDMATAFAMLGAMAGGNGVATSFHVDLVNSTTLFLSLAAGLGIVWLLPNTQQIFSRMDPALKEERVDMANPTRLRWSPQWAWAGGLGILLAICFLRLGGPSPFLYFRF